MKTRADEFIDCLGNGKTEHEMDNDIDDLDLDEDWEEIE